LLAVKRSPLYNIWNPFSVETLHIVEYAIQFSLTDFFDGKQELACNWNTFQVALARRFCNCGKFNQGRGAVWPEKEEIRVFSASILRRFV
jgi:hypothetical protein